MSTELELISEIENYYLPKNLVKAFCEIGHIPTHSEETQVGVGFIDIADYTHLSKFLSPKENQILLNGLYTAFQIVLEKHGGYLNKIEGDSMMFHFDDVIDKRLWKLNKKERITHIARELFYTCIDMQRVCILFNQAHDNFLEQTATPENKQALAEAFAIIKTLRNKNDISSTLFAFFQIRIRIGANIGEVTIGNFGPYGSKQWDIIGMPVINAKRMESTAPIGGLRISQDFFEILSKTGIAEEYFNRFRKEAEKRGGVYKNIRKDELFKYRTVVLREKKNATYQTYSVQVSPFLPESIASQSNELLNHGTEGVTQILGFFRYYRGNQYIIDLLEKTLEKRGVIFRKNELFALIVPKQAKKQKAGTNKKLYTILDYLDRYLDQIRDSATDDYIPEFFSYTQYMAATKEQLENRYIQYRKRLLLESYFDNVIVMQVYASIEASLREYQTKIEESEVMEESLEELDVTE